MAESNLLRSNHEGLVLQRLQLALSTWDREKYELNYEWLFVCARYQGEKLGAKWFKQASECSLHHIAREFGADFHRATSFELEMLHAPQVRLLNIADKNQWNSLIGIQAAMINYGGKTSWWAAIEMVARNLSFNGVLRQHLSDLSDNPRQLDIPVTLYQTKQMLCDNQPIYQGQIAPIDLFRGNLVVDIGSVSRSSVTECAQAMTRWLAAQVGESGAANYKYWPSRGIYSSSNNAIRQWMATVCLQRAASSFGSRELADIASRNLEFNLVSMFKRKGDLGYIWMEGSAKLGAAGLAALAIFESPQRKAHLNEEYALYALIQHLSNADHSFDTFFIPRERKDNQNFYSGEALLYLASRYSVGRNPKELDRIMSAFSFYRDWHRNNRNPAFVPWHTQAYYLVWQVTKDESLKDFIFEMNDWLLSMQQWESADFPDMQGRFYDPSRPHFGPPHASSTGVYLEGLIDAFTLAKQCGDQSRAENYRIAIVRGIRSLMQLQFKDEVDCFYIRHVDRVLGGVRTNVYDNTIRIDNVQHGLMALLKILNRFSVLDYESENQLTLQRDNLDTSVHTRAPKVASSNIWLREEVLNACEIVRAHNDHDWTAKKVVARTARPEMDSLYFAKQVASEELKLLHAKALSPSAIFAEAETAKTLSRELSVPIYEVANLLETARSLADVARSRASAKIIGVTGSVGKTSVKDALWQVLSAQGSAHATQANANDGWGVLDTLMNLPIDARFAVMELGMLGVGSIKIKSERIKPHVGIITNIHDSHLVYHSDESSIAHTKSGLFYGLVPNGTAVLRRDSAWYDFLKTKALQVGVCGIITFGAHPEADFRFLNTSNERRENIVHAMLLGKFVEFRMGAPGDHWGINTMAILAAVYAVGADVDAAINSMVTIKPSYRRGEVHCVKADSKTYTIIDDSWNASPASVVAALKHLASFDVEEGAERILFIGDMLQLGKNERRKHVELADAIIANGINKVFAVGELSLSLFEALPSALRGQHFPDVATASIVANEFIGNGDVVLVKGSNAMEMWRVVRALRETSKTKVIDETPPARIHREGAAI
jgi:UDP-N-acetylmuramoyl-tripeptide--D-alanyl-D-alanine ligase